MLLCCLVAILWSEDFFIISFFAAGSREDATTKKMHSFQKPYLKDKGCVMV